MNKEDRKQYGNKFVEIGKVERTELYPGLARKVGRLWGRCCPS